MIVEIYRVTGIGARNVQPPQKGWPATVVVHLHDFSDLEGFTAHGPVAQLACGQSRPEGAPARPVCHFGGEEVDAMRHGADHFEVTLPPALLEAGSPVEIHWVDQWR
jgi:hypothetical protein